VQLPGYEGVSRREFEYVLEEAGVGGAGGKGKKGGGVDFQEFVEICGNLKEVAFAAVPGKQERIRIPVEKSGGGI